LPLPFYVDDCVKYHLETSHKEGIKEEMMEAMELPHWWRNYRCATL
jgi:hypothetical protein